MTSSANKIVDISGGLGQFKSLLSSHTVGPSVVHFWADWAEQCAPMDEAIKILAGSGDDGAATTKLDKVQFLRVDAEREADVSMEFQVAAVPTILLFAPRGRKLLERVEGARVADVVKKVKEVAARVELQLEAEALKRAAEGPTAVAEEPSDMEIDLNDRLRKLISAAPLMLFMKGSPGAPGIGNFYHNNLSKVFSFGQTPFSLLECGFSRQTVDLLAKYDAKYGHFDILRDNEVRSAMQLSIIFYRFECSLKNIIFFSF